MLFCNLLPLIAIVIGSNLAFRAIKAADLSWDPVNLKYGIKTLVSATSTSPQTYKYSTPTALGSYYASKLKIVGFVEPGFSFLATPTLPVPFGDFFLQCFPVALILFMESYSVARKLAGERGELSFLNANQELFAVGAGNLLGCVGLAYPVAGSYSRSALNHVSGARTPLSKAVTLFVVLTALGLLTPYFWYIPQAVLSAIIWVAIYNLISISEFWEAWKHSKSDFIVMLVTWTITFTYDTSVGLAVGLASSIFMYLFNIVFSAASYPEAVNENPQKIVQLVSSEGIQVVSFNGDLNFLTTPKLKQFFSTFFVVAPDEVTLSESASQYYFQQITNALDNFFRTKQNLRKRSEVPGIFALDFSKVVFIDLSGLHALDEILHDGRIYNVKFFFLNVRESVQQMIDKFGLQADIKSLEELQIETYSYNI